MRCSDCFTEMKVSASGLYCESCGTEFQAVGEDGDVVIPVQPPRKRNLFKILSAVVCILTLSAAGLYAFNAFSSKRSDLGAEQERGFQVETSASVVVEDARSLVLQNSVHQTNNEVLQLLATQDCRRVSQTPSEIEWVTARSDRAGRLMPIMQDDWQIEEVCPLSNEGVIVRAIDSTGFVIGAINPKGSVAWTQSLPIYGADASSASTMIVEEGVLAVSPTADLNTHLMTAYGFNGEELWQRLLPEVRLETLPILASNTLGDIFIVYNTTVRSVGKSARVIALSSLNTVIYNVDLGAQQSSVKAVSSDHLGRLLLLEGHPGISAQLLSASGALIWRRWIHPDAGPIGVIFDGDQFLIAGYRPGTLMFWRVRESGALSQSIELPLNVDLKGGALRALNDHLASLEFENDIGHGYRLILDLTRFSEVSVFDETDSEALLYRVDEATMTETKVESRALALPEQMELDRDTSSSESAIATEPPGANPTTPFKAALVSPRTGETRVAPPTSALIDPQLPEIDQSTTSSRPELFEVQCVFTCAIDQNSQATYPIMQTIRVGEKETLENVPERLGETHVKLCALSGGKSVVDSQPKCTAQ